MTRLWFTLGIVAGALVGAVLIVFNPLAGTAVLDELPAGEYHSYASGDFYGMHQSVDGLLNVAWLRRGGGDFPEPSIRNTNASLMVLRDAAGVPVAFATKLSTVERNDNLLLGGIGMQTYWNVFWPNQGSVFMQSDETRRGMVRDGVLSFLSGGDLRATGDAYPVTADTADNRIVGVSGTLYNATGQYAEVLLNPGVTDDVQQGELTLQLTR